MKNHFNFAVSATGTHLEGQTGLVPALKGLNEASVPALSSEVNHA
jgi:hypothetical protein